MVANATFTPYPVPLDDTAVPILVARYDASKAAGSRLSLLPYVRCTRIEWHEGAAPPAARFEYVFDDSTAAADGFPDQFDQVWPIGATDPSVVRNDDRLCVYGVTSSGVRRIMWDGFAQIPQVDLSPTSQAVTFTGVGTPIRCFDSPIEGTFQRNADVPDSMAVKDHADTDLPARFNPDRTPNKTPSSFDINESDNTKAWPAFLDWSLERTSDPRSYWTLGTVCRYVLTDYNDQTFVKNPSFTQLDDLLKSDAPQPDIQFLGGPGGPKNPIVVRDYDATGKAWPDALAELLAWSGFAVRWDLSQDGGDEPVWRFAVYRKDSDSTTRPKPIKLQPLGATLDPGRSNVQGLTAAFDSNAIANRYVIETHPVRYEVSVILAPGFTPSASDVSNLANFRLKSLANSTTNREAYRTFIADEAGDGHWDFHAAAWSTTPLDLAAVLGKPDKDGYPSYVRRHRKPLSTLFSTDAEDYPFKSSLEVSLAYAGATAGKAPAVWDRTATDWTVVSGGWKLLGDQIGIDITADDPNALPLADAIPNSGEGKKLSLIERLNSSGGKTPCYFRLTVVIEGDRMIEAIADKRPASPTQYAVTRRIDCKDHFKKEVVAKSSFHNATGDNAVPRDDTPLAVAHAQAMRAAHEFPPLAGSVNIPSVTNAYEVGDRINVIEGRDISLQTNAGAEQGEAPYYPTVVGMAWTLHPNQSTTLTLGDRRMEPHRE